MIIRDQLQREITLPGIPRRIISLVPSQTELLCHLGLEKNLVGVTKFCVHPAHIKNAVQVVGGTKQVHYEKIRAQRPDIILCNKEENTEEMVKRLEEIAPVHISDVIRFEEALQLILQYGELFQVTGKAGALVKELASKKQDFTSGLQATKKRVAYFIWRDPWMVAGGDTFINTLLELNGWENIFKEYGRYPEVDLLAPGLLKADLILLSSEPFPFGEKHINELKEHFEGRIELVDGEYFSWYGSRLLSAFDYFRKFQIKLSNSL